jgi:hypothetical protein
MIAFSASLHGGLCFLAKNLDFRPKGVSLSVGYINSQR